MSDQKKLAVILFNLGGPDSPEAVKPFLFNLFNDPAIIMLPNPLRWMVAKLISWRRDPIAREIYGHIGGRSPLVPQTEAQGDALAAKLSADTGHEVKCFLAMRYWHPFSEEAVRQVQEYNPDEIVLLPLYPHYSLTTTGSSLLDWKKKAEAAGLYGPFKGIKEYPTDPGLIKAQADLIRKAVAKLDKPEDYRLLFSAHGLPKKVIDSGDPYQKQVEQTCAAVIEELQEDRLEYVTCYQSRVGPLEWIGPSTEDEIERAGEEGKSLIVVPIAFVSEHSETLVELDIEYGELAEEFHVKDYVRIPTVQTHPDFIGGLADLVKSQL